MFDPETVRISAIKFTLVYKIIAEPFFVVNLTTLV